MSRAAARGTLTLRDVILAVQDEALDDREAVAALLVMLEPRARSSERIPPPEPQRLD